MFYNQLSCPNYDTYIEEEEEEEEDKQGTRVCQNKCWWWLKKINEENLLNYRLISI